MGWPKGYKMSDAQRAAISRGRKGLKFTAKHRANIAAARLGTTATEQTKAKLSKIAQDHAADPAWRRRVSAGTRKNYNHAKQRAGVRRALKQRGLSSFFRGGQGDTPQPYVADYARLLTPAGFVQEFPVWRYRLDFAHPAALIDIEIDGSSHRFAKRRAHDAKRDAYLKALGWRVIRVREWT